MGVILYCYALVRRKSPVGREVAFTQGSGKNPANRSRIGPKFGLYGKANLKSGRFANVPFRSHMNRKGWSSSGPLSGPVGFLRVHASAFHLLSWLLSPSILEKLFYCQCFLIFRSKLLNFYFNKPKTLLKIASPMFFLKISLTINFLPFGDGQ